MSECLAVIDFLDAGLEPLDRELTPFAHAEPRAVLLDPRDIRANTSPSTHVNERSLEHPPQWRPARVERREMPH